MKPAEGTILTVSRVATDAAVHLAEDEERDVVLLSIIGGLNSNEVAALTGLSPGGVRSKLSRSLAKMREFLS